MIFVSARVVGQLDLPDDRRFVEDLAAGAPGQDRRLVEAEAVDVHLLDPVLQALDDQLGDDRMVAHERVAAAGVVVVEPPVGRVEVVVVRVVQPGEGVQRAELVAFVGVVEHHVEDHLDAGPVQRLDHVPELADMPPEFRRGAVSGVRCEERRGAVAPVVGLAAVEVEHRQQFHGVDAERGEVRDLLDEAAERARPRHPRARRTGETADVRLVDDEILHRAVQRFVALPVVVGEVDHHRTQRGGHVVAGYAGRAPLPQGVIQTAGVRVDEDLLVVEPVPLAAGLVAVGAEGPQRVEERRVQAPQVHVPDGEAAVGLRVEGDALERLDRIVRVEQQQLHARCMLGEEGKIDAEFVGVGAERMAVAAFGDVGVRVVNRRPVQRMSSHEDILG